MIGFDFRVYPAINGGYLAVARRGAFKANTKKAAMSECEWFHYGATANAAMAELRQEVLCGEIVPSPG